MFAIMFAICETKAITDRKQVWIVCQRSVFAVWLADRLMRPKIFSSDVACGYWPCGYWPAFVPFLLIGVRQLGRVFVQAAIAALGVFGPTPAFVTFYRHGLKTNCWNGDQLLQAGTCTFHTRIHSIPELDRTRDKSC
jgi:hypothetical protein